METPVSASKKHSESNPLLSSRQRAKSAALLSIQRDVGKGAVFNLRLSRWYLAYCSIMALSTLSLVIYMVVDVHIRKQPVAVWVAVVDGLITFSICCETVLDLIFLGRAFWSSGWHVFDFAVSVVCCVSWVLLLLEIVGVVGSMDEFVTVILLTIRYFAQFFRIVRYIRAGTEAQDSLHAVEEHEIRFDNPASCHDKGLTMSDSVADTAI